MDRVKAIAQAIMQGHGANAPAARPVNVQATPPQLPAFSIPGMGAQGGGMGLPQMADYVRQHPATPPQQPQPAPMPQAAPPPQVPPDPSASAIQATTSPTAVPPMPAPTPIGMAPGMGGQDQGMVNSILAALKARDPNLPPQMAMGQSI